MTLNYKKFSLNLILSLGLVLPLISEAKLPKTKVTLLSHNESKLSDPQFKLRLKSIVELTDEEALKYVNSNTKDLSFNGQITVRGDKFKIPGGVPGIAEGSIGSVDDKGPTKEDTNATGGLSLGVGVGGNINPNDPSPNSVTKGLDSVLMVIEKLVAIGEKVWPLIEKGRPAVTNKHMAAISVLPRIDAKDPVVHDMGNWSIPVTKHYRVNYTNGFGMNVVSFVYSVTFQHSGNYGGKGKYLTGVRVSARDIKVDFGFDLDSTSELIQISNLGTPENVIAGATIEISYTVKNVLRVLTTTQAFHVTGDGRIFSLDK